MPRSLKSVCDEYRNKKPDKDAQSTVPAYAPPPYSATELFHSPASRGLLVIVILLIILGIAWKMGYIRMALDYAGLTEMVPLAMRGPTYYYY